MELVEVKSGIKFPAKFIRESIPDVETLLFVAAMLELTSAELGKLMYWRFNHLDVVAALTAEGGEHSTELQDYLVEIGYEHLIQSGQVKLSDSVVPKGEVLPQLWEQAMVEVAKAITDVGKKLAGVVGSLDGKKGEMLFKSLKVMNSRRPIIGDYRAVINHKPQVQNLGILDVSGSVNEPTVRKIIEDWVALGYEANLWMAIVSNTTTYWKPGEYDVDTILAEAEYGGTHYETLAELMDQDWGVVITLADYDSSPSAKGAIAQCKGHIDEVLDISLVNRPTFLSEVVGQLADKVRPLMVTDTYYALA